ncbi:hypothetical protein OJE16_01020 [Pantoea tagorei]
MSENKRDLMPYLLYYCQSRLLVENIDGHVVDIGGAEQVGGKLRWQLDGKEAKGTTENEAEEMLNDVARHLSFFIRRRAVHQPARCAWRIWRPAR